MELHITPPNKMSLRIVVIYRPPNSNVNEFIAQLTSHLESLNTTTSDIIVTGDFNIHIDYKNDSSCTKFIYLLNTFDLKQHVNEFTHVKQHIMDLIITRSAQDTKVHEVGPLISDHLAVLWI